MRSFQVHLKDYFAFLGENGCDAVLETYLPYNMTEMNRENQKRPAVLICPGGSYAMCSQREAEPIALHYVRAGYNAFVLWYSVCPNRFPQALREVAASMELIHQNAAEWNCDENRVAIMGFSAGGHLAAHYSNAYDWPEVREVFPESKAPRASILCYPVISAIPGIADPGTFEHLLGQFPLDEAQTERFSCDRMVRDITPPAYLWHTAEDNCVSVQNSLRYATALSQHGVPFELHVFPYGFHGLATCTRETNGCEITPGIAHAQTWMEESSRWLRLLWGD